MTSQEFRVMHIYSMTQSAVFIAAWYPQYIVLDFVLPAVSIPPEVQEKAAARTGSGRPT